MPKRKAATKRKAGSQSTDIRILSKIVKTEPFSLNKVIAIQALGKMRNKRAVPALKKAVFDFNRNIRRNAVDGLAQTIGWKKTLDFVNKNFKSPGDVPHVFFTFFGTVGGRKKVKKWLKRDWNAIKKQAVIDARKKGFVRMRDKNGKVFSINDIPVFLGKLKRSAGAYRSGLLVVESNQRKVAIKDRKTIAWHEFGETFSHEAGLAFMLDYLNKTGQRERFVKRFSHIVQELKKIEENWEK